MNSKKHIGSSFDSFLEQEGILEEVRVAAVKAIIARNKEYKKKNAIIQTKSKSSKQ